MLLPSPMRKMCVGMECEKRNSSSWAVKMRKRVRAILLMTGFIMLRFEARSTIAQKSLKMPPTYMRRSEDKVKELLHFAYCSVAELHLRLSHSGRRPDAWSCLSICAAVSNSDCPVRLLLWVGLLVCFVFRREFQNSFHSCGRSGVVSVLTLLSGQVMCFA